MPRRGSVNAAKEVVVAMTEAKQDKPPPDATETNEEELAAPAAPSDRMEAQTAPDLCRVVGDGLHKVCVRQPSSFKIEAYDDEGHRKMTGGDGFFIAIRGASRVRAKVTDMRDGTYLVEWKPSVSGSYTIAVSLFGNSLPGSPYRLEVDAPFPYAPNCEARGDGLHRATARVSQTFDICYRDRLGNIAQAVELDVFVQPYHEPGAHEPAAGGTPVSSSAEATRSRSSTPMAGRSTPEPSSGEGAEGFTTSGDEEESPTGADGAMIGGGEARRTRQRTINIQVGKRPLIVRQRADLFSRVIGQLLPGQLATVVEERIDTATGDVRACVTIDDLLPPAGFESARGEQTRQPHSSPHELAGGSPPPTPSWPDGPEHGDGLLLEPHSPTRGLGALGKGWVTLKKNHEKLVTSRVRLHAGLRQAHSTQWARRTKNDRLQKSEVSLELKSDPTGIGFAFGGIEPGPLRSKGNIHETHKVSYSVGLVGRYLLHVRLRQAALPVPGSPFTLVVTPGKPHARSTHLPAEISAGRPLMGLVGTRTDAQAGCRLVMQTSDKMGNTCVAGGAAVVVDCNNARIESSVQDNDNGSYLLEWHSKESGTFLASVRINKEHVLGSPFPIQLTSMTPELSKSVLTGGGLKAATAGIPTDIVIKFLDQYSNTALPGPSFKFGLSLLKDREKLSANTKVFPFESSWKDEKAGEYELRYVAEAAGTFELHVWCDQHGKGERTSLPGSPFQVHVSPGVARADVSQVDGWMKEARGLDKHGKQIQTDVNSIISGDTVVMRPMILDVFGNVTVPGEGAITVFLTDPRGDVHNVPVVEQSRGGTRTYDVRYECLIRGAHSVGILLNGEPIKGSPVDFDVLASTAEPSMCRLVPPKAEVLYSNLVHSIVLETFDKHGEPRAPPRSSLSPMAVRTRPRSQLTYASTTLPAHAQAIRAMEAASPPTCGCSWSSRASTTRRC